MTTGGEAQVAAVIDADSLPEADVTGAGRLAVDRLRGTCAVRRRMGLPARAQPGTVKCWQDNKHTQIGAAFYLGRSVIARGGPPMGRGRAKAKQTKVARELKYSSPQTDFERLQQELSGARTDHDNLNGNRRVGR